MGCGGLVRRRCSDSPALKQHALVFLLVLKAQCFTFYPARRVGEAVDLGHLARGVAGIGVFKTFGPGMGVDVRHGDCLAVFG
jgi:hypothetical protein